MVCGKRCRRSSLHKTNLYPYAGEYFSDRLRPIAAGRVLPPLQSLDTEWPRAHTDDSVLNLKKKGCPKAPSLTSET